jgi:uncharacterized membrane protein YeaQ/YmgE (transglycosylase-associated protein family)
MQTSHGVLVLPETTKRPAVAGQGESVMTQDPNDLRRQVHAQNNAWLIQLAGFFLGALVGVVIGAYVLIPMFGGTGLLLTVVAGFVGAWIGHRLALDAVMR